MRILLIRLGAYGDMIVITPLIRHLKSLGHEIYLNTSERGMEILANNPNVDKFIPYVSNSVPEDKIQEYWKKVAEDNQCDKTINMCESIEVALSCHPTSPKYNYPKWERKALSDKNFYEYAFQHAGFDVPSHQPMDDFSDINELTISKKLRPELFFTFEEEEKMSKWFEQFQGQFVIVWGLSGSGRNKSWPWVDGVIGDLLLKHKNVRVITVGDELCQILEIGSHKHLIRRSGKWTMREAALACKYASLVVSPDTGLLHASGCYDTPKIGLIGHNTVNSVTKHFKNDFSIEADEKLTPCAPCFRLIYSAKNQCPIDPVTELCVCMVNGIPPEKVYERVEHVIEHADIRKKSKMPDLQVACNG